MIRPTEYFKAARLHLSFARKFRKLGDIAYANLSIEWAREDHEVARRILREARA